MYGVWKKLSIPFNTGELKSMIFTDVASSLAVDRHPSGIYRAAVSVRQTKALASHFFFDPRAAFKGSNHKHPKYLGRQCNHGHCLSCNFFLPKRVSHPSLT